MTAPAAPPVPTGAYRQYFPASVKVGDDPLITKARVILADTGLYVYTKVPVQRGADTEATFYAEANYAAAARPAGRVSNGYVLPLTDGRAAWITSSGGCGCSSMLKRWAPQWAAKSLPWPGSA